MRSADVLRTVHLLSLVVTAAVSRMRTSLPEQDFRALRQAADGFTVTGYRLELSGYCAACVPDAGSGPITA